MNFIWIQPFCRGPSDLVMCCPSGLWNAQFLIKIEFSILTYGFVLLTVLIHLIIMSLNWYQGLDRWVTVRKSSWFFEMFGIKFSFHVGFLWPYLLSVIIFEVFVKLTVNGYIFELILLLFKWLKNNDFNEAYHPWFLNF